MFTQTEKVVKSGKNIDNMFPVSEKDDKMFPDSDKGR